MNWDVILENLPAALRELVKGAAEAAVEEEEEVIARLPANPCPAAVRLALAALDSRLRNRPGPFTLRIVGPNLFLSLEVPELAKRQQEGWLDD